MPHDPIHGYRIGDMTPTEHKAQYYRDVPERRCIFCKAILSRYNAGEYCWPCSSALRKDAPITPSIGRRRK